MANDVLFFSGIFPKEREKEIIKNSIGNVANADNVFQSNLIKGLDANLQTPVNLLNCVNIGSYPKRYKKLMVPSYHFSHTDGANDYNIGFCNLTGYKRFSRNRGTRKWIKKWACDGVENKVLIAYAMYEAPMLALKVAKQVNRNIKTCLIVPDLPQFMNTRTKRSFFDKVFKGFVKSDLYAYLKYADSYVVLTEQMLDMLEEKPYAVVEGIASNIFQGIKKDASKKKTIVYAGALALKYGIGELIKSFSLIKGDDYRFVICGKGDAEPLVKQACAKDDRIEYLGIQPRDKVLELYMSASVLVNPRKNIGEYTKYSFPSKIMEYLSSGIPTVAYKLDGIPDEYDDYINYVTGDTSEDLAQTLVSVCECSDETFTKKAERAQKFVLEQKSANVQAKKIWDLISGL